MATSRETPLATGRATSGVGPGSADAAAGQAHVATTGPGPKSVVAHPATERRRHATKNPKNAGWPLPGSVPQPALDLGGEELAASVRADAGGSDFAAAADALARAQLEASFR
jgi:hypothetical protein